MPLEFVGMKDNKAKVFTIDELGDWIYGKVRRGMDRNNAKLCAAYIMQHSGTGGGTGHSLGPKGESIFHISHGNKQKKNEGCTVFFVGRNNKHAVIVGIGQHWSGAKNKDNVYRLDWKRGDWNAADGYKVTL